MKKSLKNAFKNFSQKSKRKAKNKKDKPSPAISETAEQNISPADNPELQQFSDNDDKQTIKELKKVISDVAVNLWRIRKKMTDEDGEPLEEFHRHYRHLQSAIDDLSNSRIEIKDFQQQIIPESGVLGIRVLAYQPTAGILSDQIIETIKPAVYYKGEMIQFGEVIVGIPENEEETV